MILEVRPLLALFLWTTPQSPTTSLDPWQIGFVGVIAILIGQLLNIAIARWKGVKTGKAVATIVVFVVSVGLSYAWVGIPLVQTYDDPMQLATKLLEQAIPVFSFATLIYNLALAKVFETAGVTQDGAIEHNGSASKDAPSEALDIVVSVIDLLMRLKTNKPNQNGEDQSSPKP